VTGGFGAGGPVFFGDAARRDGALLDQESFTEGEAADIALEGGTNKN